MSSVISREEVDGSRSFVSIDMGDSMDNKDNKNDTEENSLVCRKCNKKILEKWGPFCLYCGTKNVEYKEDGVV